MPCVGATRAPRRTGPTISLRGVARRRRLQLAPRAGFLVALLLFCIIGAVQPALGSPRGSYPPVPSWPDPKGCLGLRQPSPRLTAGQMQQITDQLQAAAKGNLQGGSSCPGGPVIVWLQPGREWLARLLGATYGSKLAIFIGLTTWDGRPGQSPACGALPRAKPLPPGLRLSLHLDRTSVTSGSDFLGAVLISELGPGRFSMGIGQPVEAVVVRRGTQKVVGVYSGVIGGTGYSVNLVRGQSKAVPVIGGTARCDGGIGSALPAGTYGVIVQISNEGHGPSPEYQTPPVPLKVLAEKAPPSSVGPGHAARADRRDAMGEVEYPFGELSVASDGTLFYVDRQHGQIDAVTAGRPRTVLSSLYGTAAANGSITGLSGLSVTDKAMWFTAGDGLYQASFSGRAVRRDGNVPGAVDLYVLADGTIFFTTATAIFERGSGGLTEHVAGGSSTDFSEQQAGSHRSVGEAINPESIVGLSPHAFYFTNENNLYLVDNGFATMLKPRFEFFNGELAAGPGGTTYGICNWSVCRIAGRAFTKLFKLPEPVNGAFAAPDALAVSPSGYFYISYSDQSSPAKTGIVELSPKGKVVAVVASRT